MRKQSVAYSMFGVAVSTPCEY